MVSSECPSSSCMYLYGGTSTKGAWLNSGRIAMLPTTFSTTTSKCVEELVSPVLTILRRCDEDVPTPSLALAADRAATKELYGVM
mmetsp:Transcript_32258/g.96089  ORF Transcript_32258/g.96089 Transcript_32258/m.96089 type:complete len:85 (+) Transcript_32258:1410-1664(+)